MITINKKSNNFCLAMAVIFCCLASCKKDSVSKSVIQPPPAKPIVKFDAGVMLQGNGLRIIPLHTNLIDSNFYFKNTSDSSSSINYKWDFGDGATSILKNPIHKYAKRGRYKVILLVNDINKVSDTSSVVLKVILGQKEITLGDNMNVRTINILQTPDKGFLMMCMINPGIPLGPILTYSLIKTDSLFNQQSKYDFPANYAFLSFQPAIDGNYLLTGSSSGNHSNYNELFEMSANGTILWSKTYPNATSLIQVQQPDNSSMIIVAQNSIIGAGGNTYPITNIIKTDASGNQLWFKLFNNDLTIQLAYNLVLETDGFVFAGDKPYTGGTLSYKDSLIAVKMDYSGNILWKNTTLWGVDQYAPNETFISKNSAGNYCVITLSINYGVYILSPQGTLISKLPQRSTPLVNSPTSDGNTLLLYTAGTDGAVAKLDALGTQIWRNDVRIGVPKTINEFEKDKYLISVEEAEFFPSHVNYHYVIQLSQLDKGGNLL